MVAKTGRFDFEITPILGDGLVASEIALIENSNFVYTTDGGAKTWVALVPIDATSTAIKTETEVFYDRSAGYHVQNSVNGGEEISITTEKWKSIFYWRIFSKLWQYQKLNSTNRITLRDYNFLSPDLALSVDGTGNHYVLKTGVFSNLEVSSGRARRLASSSNRTRYMEGISLNFLVIY